MQTISCFKVSLKSCPIDESSNAGSDGKNQLN